VCDQAVALFEKLTHQFGALADCRHLLALNLATRGEVWQRLGNLERAEADLEASRTLLDRLHRDFPKQPGYAVDLARTLNRQARVHTTRGRSADAVLVRQQALAAAEAALACAGDHAEARQEMHATLDSLVAWYDAAARRQDRPAARKGQTEALQHLVVLRQKKLRAARPEEANDLREKLASTRLSLARATVELGDHPLASRTLRDLLAAAEVPPDWAGYAGAAVAARYLGLIEQDRRLRADQKRQTAQRCAELTLDLLRRACQRKGGTPPGLFDQQAFAPLRRLADFRHLRSTAERDLTSPRR
jgi:hypothetical protein